MHNTYNRTIESKTETPPIKSQKPKSEVPSFFKHSKELESTFQNISNVSHDFNSKRFNNYNNMIRNASKELLQKYEIYNTFDKRPFPARNVSPDDINISLGSCYGTGGRTFLYSSSPKRDRQNQTF